MPRRVMGWKECVDAKPGGARAAQSAQKGSGPETGGKVEFNFVSDNNDIKGVQGVCGLVDDSRPPIKLLFAVGAACRVGFLKNRVG